ncbi:MAG: NAD-dependent epimerase/dehydratase [Cyclobacteriaceae bacterium]|nr:NAD-dependent epimerase/dehydratase [Cyclobacteriaceae bacterium]
MNVLITGGTGYIGTELVRLLANDNSVDKVIIYDNLSRQNFNLFLGNKLSGHAKVKLIKGELLDSRGLKKALDGIDVVYHLAARVTTPFAHSDAHLYEQINHWGTAELVYAVESSAVKKFIYASSAGVYGSSDYALDESVQPNPKTFYAISKLRGEEHVVRLSDKMDTYIFRCGNVYGYSPSMRFDAVINKFVFEANFEKRITIHGNGDQARTFVHIDLISKALANVLKVSLSNGTYNLVERTLSVMDIVDELKQLIPDLEFILINQQMKVNQLIIKENNPVNQLLGIDNKRTLHEELQEFLSRLSF